jgi:adenylate cyclase
MPRLVACDLAHRDRIHRQWSLEEDVALTLGRGVPKDHLLVEWDDQIAPRHASAIWKQGRLHIDRTSDLSDAHPIFYGGRQADSFQIIPGEGFVIGRTVFRLDALAPSTPVRSDGSAEPTVFYAAEMLHTMTFDPTEEQLSAIRDLLHALDSDNADLDAFANLVVTTVRRVIRAARYVAVLRVERAQRRVLVHVQSDPTPGLSEKLVLDACRRQEIADHCWSMRQQEQAYPPVAGVGWAFCAPVIASQEGQDDLALYLSGPHAPTEAGLRKRALPEDQCVFLSVVASLLRDVRTIHDLQRYQTWMQAFFPKPIRNLIQQRGPEDVFRQELARAAVLFCDLRGSCRIAESGASQLMQSWERMQAALSVMTEAITNHYGTIGDFQGDAAMGFWGWPGIGSAARDLTEAVKAACKAADTLRERFHQKARAAGPLAGFACGMGIAAGEVVAGTLGTDDQRKIGVFGPVVNLAARLESMTKQFGTSILIDQTAHSLLAKSDTSLGQRSRYLGTVLPVGMDQPIQVYELMPSEADRERLPRAKLQLFEQGQEQFEQGNWAEARRFLERVADSPDGPSRFLLEYMQTHKTPPPDFRGVMALTRK